MATMDYRVITTAPESAVETIQHPADGERWTNETATDWARLEGRKLPDGTRIAIDRRRGNNMYQAHRRYEVNDGITRRTDR